MLSSSSATASLAPSGDGPRGTRAGRAWLLAIGVVVAGCGSRPSPAPAAPAPRASELRQVRGGGAVEIPRPTPQWVHLSLWVSAGSLDAEPAALATIAARWAATSAGAQVRVLPDATELSLDCHLEEERLARCVRQLVAALSPPEPSDTELASLVRRLRADRLRKQRDVWERLEREALAPLLGVPAARLSPLGEPEQDGALTRAALMAFLRDHYGPNRALLVGAGDLSRDALQDWTQGLSPARLERPKHRPRTPGEGLTVVNDAGRGLVLALRAPDQEAAARLAGAFQRSHPGTAARTFWLDGNALLLLRLPVADPPWNVLRTAVFDARRLTREGALPARAPAPARSDLRALASQTGEAWIRGTPAAQAAPDADWQLSVALALTSPEPVSPEDPEAGARVLERWRSAAREAVQAADAQLEPRLRGDAGPERARVQLDNGVEIEVQRRAHDERFAALVAVQAGAALDGVGSHGRAALLATAAASACAFAPQAALTEQLRQEGTRMRPLVSATRWGVLTYGPAVSWQVAVDRLLRCVVRPSFRARDLEDARIKLLSRLHRDSGAELAWRAAQTLSPAAPGRLAPWGSPAGLAGVSDDGLRWLHDKTLRGSALTVTLRVPGAADAAAAYVARRLAQLPEGEAPPLPPAPALEQGPGLVRGARSDDAPGTRAWIGLRSSTGDVDDVAALAVAEQLAHRLHALPAYRGLGVAAGGSPEAWLWMGLHVSDPQALDALPGAVSAAAESVRRSLPDAVAGALEAARRRAASDRSDPAAELRMAFSGAPVPSVDVEALRTLLRAPPTFLVLWPTEPPDEPDGDDD